MPTFFEIIAETLDRAYEDLSEDEYEKALEDLSAHFNNVLTHGGPSYEDPITRGSRGTNRGASRTISRMRRTNSSCACLSRKPGRNPNLIPLF
jgi:hypothetical protein